MLRPLGASAPATAPDDRCPLGRCDGSGWLVDETNTAHPCDCLERRRRVGGRLKGSLPRRMQEVSFDRVNDVDPSQKRHVRRFAERVEENLDEGRGLWFHGGVGTAKTSLALLVVKAAHAAGRSVAVYSVPLLLAEIKGTYDREAGGDSYLRLFRRLVDVDLLLLDDLGAEKQTEWVLEQLYSLVNERWQDRRSIVVTSNTPDPYRDTRLATLREEIAALRKLRKAGAAATELEAIAERLERTAARLEALQIANDADPVTQFRQQLGSRTVSRLLEICDEPLVLDGPDLRVTSMSA